MPAIVQKEKNYNFSDYLELEKETNERHELFYGEVFNLAGGTLKHNMLCSISSDVLKGKTEKDKCFTFINDVKLELDTDRFYVYPDVVISCDKKDLSDLTGTIIKNPVIIVEVLSDSTELYDRNIKKHYYLKLASLKYYLLVSQNEMKIEMYEKLENRIEYSSYETLEETMKFRQLDFEIKVSDIYTEQVLK